MVHVPLPWSMLSRLQMPQLFSEAQLPDLESSVQTSLLVFPAALESCPSVARRALGRHISPGRAKVGTQPEKFPVSKLYQTAKWKKVLRIYRDVHDVLLGLQLFDIPLTRKLMNLSPKHVSDCWFLKRLMINLSKPTENVSKSFKISWLRTYLQVAYQKRVNDMYLQNG